MTQPQPSLFDLPPQPAREPSPVAVERKRLNAAALRVLARLKQGPATNAELVAVGGIRAVGRVWDCQRDGWLIEKAHVSGGTWRYTLIGMKPL